MIIIVGSSHAKDVEDRDSYVAAFGAMVARARTQDGCVDFAITADPVDASRSNILEVWQDEEAWKTWRKIARGPKPHGIESHVSLFRSGDVGKLSCLSDLSVIDFLLFETVLVAAYSTVLSPYVILAARARKFIRSSTAVRRVNRATGAVMAGAAGLVAIR
ncbi:MAG: antibiotic biosynthesis monooxygenase [Pseudorhizobium sp.]